MYGSLCKISLYKIIGEMYNPVFDSILKKKVL